MKPIFDFRLVSEDEHIVVGRVSTRDVFIVEVARQSPGAGLKTVVSALLADVEPWSPARRKSRRSSISPYKIYA